MSGFKLQGIKGDTEGTGAVVSSASARAREFRITPARLRQIFYCAAGSFAVLLVSVFALIGYSLHVHKQVAELAVLRQVNQQQEQRLVSLENDSKRLQQKITQVDQLDLNVRRSMGMQVPDNTRTKVPSRGEYSRVSRPLVAPKARVFRDQKEPAVRTQDLMARIEALAIQDNAMLAKMQAQAQSLRKVEQRVVYVKAKLAATPSIMPVLGRLSSPFGWRTNPRREYHPGVDLAIAKGTPVRATADGTVVFSGNKHGYGNTIMISHGYGYQTLYGHNSVLVARVGDKVKKGQVVAKAGSTGYSTGPHCHYEVYQNGQRVDPSKFY